MRIIANICSAPGKDDSVIPNAAAHLTAVNSGWLLSFSLNKGGRRLVGGHFVEGDGQIEAASESLILSRLNGLTEFLQLEQPESLEAIMHLTKAAQTFDERLHRRRPAEKAALSARRLRIAMQLLASNLSNSISTSQVAKACYISEGHLRRAFRATTGLSPRQWRQEKRLQFCRRQLAETNEPLSAIAWRSGFTVQNHFSRVFTRSTGMSPTEWRRVFRSATQGQIAAFNVDELGDHLR